MKRLLIAGAIAALVLAGCGGSGSPDDSSRCHPSYSKCLDPTASDYDCKDGGGDGPKYVEGPVRLTGADPFDLDRENDGRACEPYP